MKKLMTMLAVVGMAFGLFADDEPATGGAYAKTSIEAGETDQFPTGWVKATDDDSAAATFEETGVENSSEAYTAKSVRYDGFVPGNDSFLQVKNSLTGTPLYYNIGDKAQAIEDNVCFDTLVQFTEGCDEDPAVNADAKIAVWLKTTDAAELEPGVEAETNLYITAGIVENNEIVQHNFLVADSGIEPGSWHRVTIRTIANVLTTTPALPGFIVYIDGNIVSDGDSYNDLSLNTAADRFAGKGQLFVSAAGEGEATIQSIGFAGRGYADDISVTWGDQVPKFAFPATDAKIVAEEGLLKFQYKINDGDYIPVTVGDDDYPFQVMDGDIVYFKEDGFEFKQSEEKAYTKGTITATGFQYDDEIDGWQFSGVENPSLTIGVTVTEFAVKVGDMGFASAELALAYLESPEGKTFVGRVNFLKSATALGYTFPVGTTIDVANGGNWLVTVPEHRMVCDTIGAMAEKQIVVNGNLYLTGTILGNGRVETTVTVTNGTCTVGLAGLTVGDASDGNGAALIIGEAGSLVLETEEEEEVVIAKAKITLGANGRVVVPTAVTVEDVFTAAPTGKKIVPTELPEEAGWQYKLAALDQVLVTVANTGAIVTGVATGDYTENDVVTFKVEPAEGYKTPITVEKDGDELTPDEDGKYTFTVGTEAIVITVTATAKNYVAEITSGANTFKFESATGALAKVQELEADAANFPITVTALAALTVPGLDSQTITLAKGGTITITAAGWVFTGDVEGEVTLAPGKSITVPTGLTNFKVNAPAGYAVVLQTTMDTVTYTVTNGFEVTFANGAVGAEGTQTAVPYTYGASVTAPACTFTYTGYDFVAWTNVTAGGAAIAAGAALDTTVIGGYTLTAVWAENAAPTPIPHDDKIEYTGIKADNADAACNKVEIKSPDTTVVDDATYAGYFTKSAELTGDGVYTVTATLKPEIVKAAEETKAVADELSDIAAATGDTKITIPAAKVKAGLWYSLNQGQVLGAREEGTRVQATSEGVTLTAKHYDGSGFYQIMVNTAPAPVLK